MNGGGTSLEPIVPGLYLIGVSPSPASPASPDNASYAYYLTQTDPGQPPTLAQTWQSPDYVGWYLFLPEAVADPASFVTDARTQLPIWTSGSQNPRGIVWLTAETAFASASSILLYMPSSSLPFRTNTVAATFIWSPLQLSINTGVKVTFDATAGVFTIDTSTNFTIVQLFYGTIAVVTAPYVGNGTALQWIITVPLTGAGAGALATTVALDLGYLVQTFACGFRYFFEQAGELADLYYTFVPPVALSTSNQGFLAFALRLHPIHAADPAATHFALDFGDGTSSPPNIWQKNSAGVTAPFFLTTDGGAFTLAPLRGAEAALSPPGFAFGVAPSPSGSPPSQAYYLAPAGRWQVQSMQSPKGSPATGGSQWLCGLTVQESLELAVGDSVGFVAGMPAYAPAFGSGASVGGGGTALDPTFTTSWLEFPVGEAVGNRAYYGMPGKSIYYAAVGEEFSAPVASRLSTFAEAAVFPIVPYGGIYASASASAPVPPFNSGVDAAAFAAFESLVLSGERHTRATLGTTGPIFELPQESRAMLTAFEAATPPSMPSALTPQGFVAELNEDGSWNRLYLARSAVGSGGSPATFLSFDAAVDGRVVPELANVLLQDQLFLVVANGAALGPFSNQLTIEGFNFTLDVAASPGAIASSTLLIFKFNTAAALTELVERPDLWSAKDTFTGDVVAAQQQIRRAIETAAPTGSVASPGGGDAFAYFRQIIACPSWTGVLALNCAIDGNGMPLDFQMLLGGINGQLRAHHLGVKSNRVRRIPGASVALEESSLFGVIHYPAELQSPPPVNRTAPVDYEVETITVVFSNSRIMSLNVVVGLTINQLFGRDVVLLAPGGSIASPANTLEIAGQYQVRGGVGVVLFNTSQPFVYRYPVPEGTTRVLDQAVFHSASLVPVSSSQTTPGDTTVSAMFGLAGGLWFRPDPFPNAGELDLFSYGHTDSPSGGLAFIDLTVNVVFELDERGTMRPGSKSVAFDLTPMQVTASPAALRPGSLLDALPLQLSNFLYSDAGLNVTALGATPIHVLQLEGATSAGSPVLSPASTALALASPSSPPARPAASPNVTAAPQFALEYDLPLGSLGSLSSIHAGINAKLLLGWGPSRLVPGSDAAAVLVQLPQLAAGYGGFELQGILKTVFGDANLLQVDVGNRPIYAILFNNIKLSLFGFTFPPGVIIDFLLFAGKASETASTNTSNIAWFLGARQQGSTS